MTIYKSNKTRILSLGISLFLILILFTKFNISGYAQQLNETNNICNSAKKLIETGSNSIDNAEYQKATVILIEVVNMGIQDSCPELQVEAYSLLAKAFVMQYDIENSLTNYLNAIAIAEKLKSDSITVNLYRSVGDIFFQKQVYQKAAEYYKMAYDIVQGSEQKSLKIYLLENIGLSNLGYSNNDEAIWAYENILVISDTAADQRVRSRAFFQLSEVYRTQKDWVKAIENSEKLLDYMNDSQDTLGIVLSLNNLAYYQVSSEDFDSAELNLTRALELSKDFSLPSTLLAGMYTNLGICYQNQGNYTWAINNLNNAIAFIDGESNPGDLAKTQNTLAWVYYQKGDNYNASQQSRFSIEWAKKSEDPAILAECYRTYSILLREGNDHIGAFEYFEKYSAIRDSLEIDKRVINQQNEELLTRLEKTEKEQKLYIADKEMQALMLKQLRLESERQKQEIELLRREREMEQLEKDKAFQALQLTKREHEAALQQSTIVNLEQENAIKEFQIKQKEAEEMQREKEIALLQSEKERQQLQIEKEMETRKRAIWMLVLSSLILIVVIAGLIITRKKNALLAEQKKVIEHKNKNLEQANTDIIEKNLQLSEQAEEIRAQNEEITTQRDLIEEKNKNITDSIQYASLIQNAVLPDEDILTNFFVDFFVIYKPRDIVSGDFWWFHNSDNRHIIAVADCTGHGVPGAFLSMLGTTLLNEIANQTVDIQANELLNKLKEKIVEALVHSEKGNPRRDGMDIAVCIFNKHSHEVEIAGANNPVYVLRNNEIDIIKGDKAPIGLHHTKTPSFTLKTYEWQPGDKFYLFSDGYPDQFGGEDGRKLMYKNFRDLIKSSGHMTLKDQGIFLEESFNKWQGYNEQVDDVLVVGLMV